MGPITLVCLFAAALAFAGGWIIVRAELRAVGGLQGPRVPLVPGTQPKVGPRLVLATLQTMLAAWTIGTVVGFGVMGWPASSGAPNVAVDVIRRATVAGCLMFLPLSIATLVYAASSLRQHNDDGKGVAPLIAASIFLVALFAIYMRPSFWGS